MLENQEVDFKSLRFLKGRSTDWNELAKDCVCFANAAGGKICIGIEDEQTEPPTDQKISDPNIIHQIEKAINNRTINTGVKATIIEHENGGEFIELIVFRSTQTIASTTDGKYYIRISDQCNPIPPDEMARLAADKNAFVWEEQVTRRVSRYKYHIEKKDQFISDIINSTRVTDFIKEMSEDEILDYYFLTKGDYLTNLGILWIGERTDRANIFFAPTVQIIRYNEHGDKIWKKDIDDFNLNPKEILAKILYEVPDWQESTEISDGIFRKNIPFIPIEIVRELVANALVHRTYTTRGDIFINIYPDRLEIHSPGRLPYGVTPENIINQSIRRNEHLSKIFYDLNLMEKEGSGYDLVYELLLSNGKQIPQVIEGIDRVTVVITKQILNKEVVKLMDKASAEFQLKQKEKIILGLIAQYVSINAISLFSILNLRDESILQRWIGRLLDLEIVQTKGRTKGTEYIINPEYLRRLNFKGKTNLKKIEPHRLSELIYQDLTVYPNSQIGQIHKRIGSEILLRKIKLELDKMVIQKKVIKSGDRRWTLYSINVN